MEIINYNLLDYFNMHKYVKIPSFFKNEQIIIINNILNKLKNGKYYKHTNNYIFNKKRKQFILYQNNLISNTKKNETILKKHFNMMKDLLYEPLKIYYLRDFCNKVGKTNNYILERIAYIEVSPGCVEQPVHTDPLPIKITQGMFYITVALENTSKEMGGTIVYDYQKIKNKQDLKNLSIEELLLQKKLIILNRGDINIHNNITVHHGAANNSNKTRKLIFLIFTIKNNRYMNEVKLVENMINNKIITSIDVIKDKTIFQKKITDVEVYNKKKYVYLPKFIDNDKFQNIKNIVFDLDNNNKYSHYSNNWFNRSDDRKTRQKIFLYIKNIVCLEKETEDEINKHYNMVYNKLINPLSDIISKIKKLHNTNYVSIDRIVLFKVSPGEQEQNIHLDGPIKIEDKAMDFDQCYVIIPLHDTPSEMGGTAYYDDEIVEKYKNELDEKYNNVIGYGSGFGYYNDLKGEKLNDFKNARRVIQYNERDIAIHNNYTLHNGTANNTNKMRYFLLLVVHSKKSKLIPIAPLKITMYNDFKCIDIMNDEDIQNPNLKLNLDNKYDKTQDKVFTSVKRVVDKKKHDPMVDFFNKKYFLNIQRFFLPKEIYKIINIISYLKENNELSKGSNNWGNNFVVKTRTPGKRLQTFLYAHLEKICPFERQYNYKQINYKQINSIIMEHFQFIQSLLRPIIYTKLDKLVKRLFGKNSFKWNISRITIMDIYSGSEEQEIHVDGVDDPGTHQIYVLIPLVDHDQNLGGTIYYDNEIVGKYHSQGKMNFGYFKDLNKTMKTDFEKAKCFNPPLIGDITIHTNKTIHGGAENKSGDRRCRRILFLILTVYDDDNLRHLKMVQPMTILKSENINGFALTLLRNKTLRKLKEHNMKIIDPNEYINQYNILPQTFTNDIKYNGYYIVKNKKIKNILPEFINLIKDIEKLQEDYKLYATWIQEGFSGNPYLLHDKREMIELYQGESMLLKATTQGIRDFGQLYGKDNADKISQIHFNNILKTHNIMLHFTPLIFNITQKLNYNHFTIANVKYYKILPGGKDQQLHCDGTFDDNSKGDNIYLIYSLKDTTIEMGGTNYYLNHKLDDKWKNINSNDEDSKCIGFIESLKDKEMFYNAEYKALLKKGELSIHLHNTIHKGCGNTSNVSNVYREFLFFLIRAFK